MPQFIMHVYLHNGRAKCFTVGHHIIEDTGIPHQRAMCFIIGNSLMKHVGIHHLNRRDMEVFLNGIMEKETIPNEYYMFAGSISIPTASDVEKDIYLDEPASSSTASSSILDPFDIIYSNIPDNTHILKHIASCKHREAKKFEYETNGFCYRNG